jgi:hypothetical protein
MPPVSRHECFWGALPRKIHLANKLYEEQGSALLAKPDITQQLERMNERAASVSKSMQNTAIPEQCTICATTSKNGGCCSLSMADENDTILLLANLLAGNEMRVQRNDGRECSFLGQSGCSLRFKPMFCLNYLCSHIRERLAADDLRKLDRATGLLLQEQYRIEQMLLAELKAFGSIT